MDDALKAIFDTLLLEWEKDKASTCANDLQSIECQYVDKIRKDEEDKRNEDSYYAKTEEERTAYETDVMVSFTAARVQFYTE